MVSIRDSLFGSLAERSGFATKEQVEECLMLQESYRVKGGRVPRLGEMLAQKGYMTAAQVRAVLRGQHAAEEGLFGEAAVRLAFTTRERVRECLDAQRSTKGKRLGQILAGKGYLTPAQVHAVLEAQGKRLVKCPGCGKRINAAGLVPGRQITCPGCRNSYSLGEVKVVPRDQLAVEFDVKSKESPPEKKLEIGGYEILTKLGTDGSGTYCKARHLETGATCALKIMSREAMSDKTFVKRFVQEGKRGTELRHRNIKRLYEVGVDKGRYYFSTEFVEGASLRRVLEGGKKLPPQQAIDIAIKAGEALEYSHSRGVLHGDIRPSNVIIAEDGTVKLAGLGLAKDVGANLRHFARSKEVTAFYLAPEQAVDDTRVDERTDVYSLGATLYHMVTGRPPYEGDSPLEILMRMSEEELPPPEGVEPRVPVELSRAIMRMLADEPGKRHQSMAECLAEVRQVRDLLAAGKATYSTVVRPPVTPSRHARTVKIPLPPRARTRRGLATVGAGDREAVGTSPRITGLQRPAEGGKRAVMVAAVILVAGGALLAFWLLSGPTKTFGDQARDVRRGKERELAAKKVEFDESVRQSDVVAASEEFRTAMKFATDNPGSPEAVRRLEGFIDSYPDSLHKSLVEKRLVEVKARQAASEFNAISKRAAQVAGRHAELIAEVDAWLERHPAHQYVDAARSLKVRLETGEAEAFREAMAKVDALVEGGNWEEALAELDRAAMGLREALAAGVRKKRGDVEALRKKAGREEEARLAGERAEAEKRRKEAEAREALARAVQAALDALRTVDFTTAREALLDARASVGGTPREKELEGLIAGVELAEGALASLPGRFRPEARLEVTRAGTRSPVSGVDENGFTVTIETRGRKLDFLIPWKRLSAEDLYSALSLLADWKDADYLVGAAVLCAASEKPSYAKSFLVAAARRRDVSLYEKLAEGSFAPAPEEAAPEIEPEAAVAPAAEEEAPAVAGEAELDLSELEEMGGQWERQGDKLVGTGGSVRMRLAGLESISGVFAFSALDGSAEVTAGRWNLRFLLARKQLACGAGGGQNETTDFPAAVNTPYAWSISLEGGQAVFKVGAKERARFPSQRQDGQLWFTLITNSYVTISGVKLRQTGKRAAEVKQKPVAPPAGAPTPTPAPTAPVSPMAGKQLDGWTVGEGNWEIDEEGVLTGSASEGKAWISRPIRKPFVIEVEVEGRAHLAGITFGQAKEFMVVPAGGKQTILLEVKNSIRFLVDGKETSSAGFSVRATKPAHIGNEFRLEVRVGRVRFRVKTQEGG